MRKVWLAGVAFVTAVSGAHAQTKVGDIVTVQKLLEFCKTEMTPEWAYCLGAVQGATAVMLYNGVAKTVDGIEAYLPSMCAPTNEGPSGGALIQAFVNWATAHPEDWGLYGMIGVMKAAESTWPCP